MQGIRRKFFRYSLWMMAFAGLAGCVSTPKVTLSGLQSFSRPPICLKVGAFEVVKEYLPPEKEPNVDHLLNPPPFVIAEQWAQDRFKMTGCKGRAVLFVEEASIVEEPVLSNTGLFSSPLIKYKGDFAVKLEIRDESGASVGSVQATASASRTVSESLTVRAREKAWLCLTETLINQLDPVLEAKIQEYLSDYLG